MNSNGCTSASNTNFLLALSDAQNQPNVFKTPYRAVFSSLNISFTGHFIEKNTDVVNMRTAQKEMLVTSIFITEYGKSISLSTRCITILDFICATRTICVFLTLSVLASESICGKWTLRREGVNKKGQKSCELSKI